MNPEPTASALPSRAELLYRRLLACYPAEFRVQYSAEMAQIFSESWSNRTSASLFQRLHFIVHVLRDWAGSVAAEWWQVVSWHTKLGFVGLGATITLDLLGGNYYPAACWLFVCANLIISYFVLGYGSRLSTRGLAMGAVILTAIDCLIPQWLEPLTHFRNLKLDLDEPAQIVALVTAVVVMSVEAYRHQSAVQSSPPIGVTRRKISRYQTVLWMLVIMAPAAGYIYALITHSEINHGDQLWLLTSTLYLPLQRKYLYPASSRSAVDRH